jgi:hypothetical protein
VAVRSFDGSEYWVYLVVTQRSWRENNRGNLSEAATMTETERDETVNIPKIWKRSRVGSVGRNGKGGSLGGVEEGKLRRKTPSGRR